MARIEIDLHRSLKPIGPFSNDDVLDHRLRNLTYTKDLTASMDAESTRLFDVCNAFIDALERVSPNNMKGVDLAVFDLIERGGIPQVPKLKRGEIEEFIQKIAFALSSVSRLAILRGLHMRPMMRATVATLEMATGIASQTLRRHLKILLNCRLVRRTLVGQTFLYESIPMRLGTIDFLWRKLIDLEDDPYA